MENKTQTIWTNRPSLTAYEELFSKEYPNYTEEDKMAAVLDHNAVALCNLKEKLNACLPGTIIAIGTTGNSEQKTKSFKVLNKKTIADILCPRLDGLFTCYLDENGELMCGEINKETGENYLYRYRLVRDNISDNLKKDFFCLLDVGIQNEAAIEICSVRLGDFIGEALQIDIPLAKSILN